MIFSKELIVWYSENKRSLPWRQTNSPYYIWLSEIILQQTQVKQGLPYYDAFVANFSSVFDLAEADEADVLKLWQGLGYYSRARNLHATAKYVAEELNGVFPKDYEGLVKLKGIGDYTASAIASICYKEPTAVVDGNVYRVLSRIFDIDTPINSSQGGKEFKALAQELIDKRQPDVFNQAIMEFGAIQCKPKNPNCNVCPFNQSCIAYKTNRISELPVKIKAAKAKKRYFNFLVFISSDDKTILEKREGKGIWQNLFQFPLIETNNNIDSKNLQSLINDMPLLKNQDYEITLYNQDVIVHKLSHQHLYSKFWIINVDHLNVKAINKSEIRNYAVPALISDFIESFNF